MAHETNSLVEGKLQEQLTAAQQQLFAEKQRRADAEGEAQVWPSWQQQRQANLQQPWLAWRDRLPCC